MSPLFGLMVDKVGKTITWVMCAVVTTLASHLMLAFTFWTPWIPMVSIASNFLKSVHMGQSFHSKHFVCIHCALKIFV